MFTKTCKFLANHCIKRVLRAPERCYTGWPSFQNMQEPISGWKKSLPKGQRTLAGFVRSLNPSQPLPEGYVEASKHQQRYVPEVQAAVERRDAEDAARKAAAAAAVQPTPGPTGRPMAGMLLPIGVAQLLCCR
jgi:hypothetical protein